MNEDLYQHALQLRLRGDSMAALQTAEQFLREQAGHRGACLLAAACELDLGREGAAATRLNELLDNSPLEADAIAMLARIEGFLDSDTAWMDRLTAATAPEIEDAQRATALFVLADVLDRSGKFEQAAEICREANGIRAAARPFDAGSYVAALEGMEAAFPVLPEADSSAGSGFDQGEDLVFMLGLPRSGSTLCEQILAAHPGVRACGELSAMQRIEEGMAAASLSPFDAPPQALDYARGLYRNALPGGPEGAIVIDKALFNFERLPLIHRLFPRAKFIHIRRHPLDNLLSAYQHDFLFGQDWSFDLDTEVEVYLAQERLMEHWKRLLSALFRTVQYETLVTETESVARDLAEFLGLVYDPAMAQPEAVQRAVNTASSQDVRKAVHDGSVKRWANYSGLLRSAADRLAAAGLQVGDS